MDGMPDGNHDGFANSNLFADSQQFNTYDNLNPFPNGSEPSYNDASWGVNASDYPSNNHPTVSRGLQPAPGWQGTHHLSTSSAQQGYNGPSSAYVRSLNHSPAPYAHNAYANYGSQPDNFAYQQPTHPSRPPPQTQQVHQPQRQQLSQQQTQPQRQYDPSIVTPSSAGQNFNLGLGSFNAPTSNATTIAPQALEHERHQPNITANAFSNPSYAANNFPQARQNVVANPAARAQAIDPLNLPSAIPRSSEAGIFSIINFDELTRNTNSERMGNYLTIGKQALEWNVTRSAIPSYAPRKSRNDLRRIAGPNDTILAKIGKGSSKAKSWSTASKPAKFRPIPASASTGGEIKYEPISSSEDDSSDDDSSDSDDSDFDSPLPAKRPDTLKGSVEYDTIKALWRSKRRSVDAETIRKALVDFWEVVKTIRDRWKVDAAAVSEAEEKKRTGELPLLKSRVKDQRDMIEAAFKAALKHGNRAIVELLSENVSLLFVCYQFLLDRFKEDDVNGSVSRAILETMSTFTTLTESKLGKTHIVKVLPRYQKKGDAKTQYWVKKILANVEIASKEAATKDSTGSNESKKSTISSSLEPSQPASPSIKRAVPEPIAGVKRAAGLGLDGTATKKVATGIMKPANSAAGVKTNGIAKKPTSALDRVSKPAVAAAAAATIPALKKTVVAKPSGFFSNLQSASKKPGTSIADKPTTGVNGRPAPARSTTNTANPTPKPAFSFAETMANLSKPKEEKIAPKAEKAAPQETAEEKAKRLRKEERRKLHVSFRSGEDLVQIRYFVHDPEEEIDHDSSQMRDVADVGGEGRMFKQQQHMMDIDDDDEPSEEPEKLIDFQVPSRINFDVVDPEERKRNYARFGGGELQVESSERSIRESHENNTLMVIYADPSQIPPNPREPTDPYNGASSTEVTYFGDAEEKEKFTMRVHAKRAALPKRTAAALHSQTAMNGFDYGQQRALALEGVNSRAVPAATPDIQSILAALRQSASTQPAYAQPAPGPTPSTYPTHYATGPAASTAPTQQPPSATNGLESIDLAAILATLNGNNQNTQEAQQRPGRPPPSMMGLASHTQQPSMFGDMDEDEAGDEEDVALIRAKNPFYKTKVCRFWQEGRCQKGTNCSYLHE